MPRYHFHVVDGVEVFDSLGAVLPNDAAAQRRAVELAADLAKKASVQVKAVRVTSSEGDILFRVPIRHAARPA